MSQPMHFSPLQSSDAGRIGRLQRKLFPPELTESEDELRDILLNTEKHMVCNLSFGLFDGEDLVGYVFAYVESASIFYKRDEEVVYIKEIALSPGYERFLKPLFSKLIAQCVTFAPNTAVEAHAQDNALAQWRRLDRFFRSLGLTLATKDEPASRGRPPYKLLRLDSAMRAASIEGRIKPLPEAQWHYRDGVTVTVVQTTAQWLSLKESWDKLLMETDDWNVFQSFDYLWEWWKHFGSWNDLRVVVLRRGDSVIGVVPLMLEYFPIFGRIVRKLMFISAPMEMSRPKLIFGRNTAICLPAFLAYMQRYAADWDILDIDEQLNDGTADAMRQHFRECGYMVAESGTVCPYIDIAGSWQDFMAGRSRNLRSNINRLRRKLEASGEVVVRKFNSWPGLEKALLTHCEIEERSWKAEKHLHISADKGHFFFYKALAKTFGRNEAFELRLLECAGKPVASTFGIVGDGVFQSLKIAHDGAYDNLSPGTVLESFELEDLFGQGVSRYEFMGSFLANKLRWTSTVHETTNLHIYQRQPRLILFFFTFFVFKRKVKAVLKKTGQFDRVEKLLGKLKKNPFPRY